MVGGSQPHAPSDEWRQGADMHCITGMAVFNAPLGQKRIEFMKELMPTIGVVGYLLNPSNQMSERPPAHAGSIFF
jgi:ABC-type uncharacterized transport system substrate-binding protein